VTDLVIASLERWDAVWRRNQYLIDGLLRVDPDLRVLFVEPAADPAHDLSERRRPRFGSRVQPMRGYDRLWTLRPTKLLPRRVDPRVDERLVQSIVAAARRIGFTAPVLWVNDPGVAGLLEATGWPAVYDITDDWLAANRSTAELARLTRSEEVLLERAAEVVVCSAELKRRNSPLRPEERHPIVLIPNAVDVASYRLRRSRPEDLPAGRTAVYAGTVHGDRFDVSLTAATAKHLTGAATVVLVGPDLLSDAAMASLRDAGVVLLGPRTPGQLVGYLQHADVLLVPHVVNAFTDSLDPIKLYEYQAVGRPVVSTAVAGFRDADDDRIVVADAATFADAVARAIERSAAFPAEADRSVADWSDRVDAMRTVLRRLGDPSSAPNTA
jgi:teichuronic acid biosynthesis glycosyltransferase TuaH